ncbi:MAG: hypothetical protein BMS9Abin33_1154 [Gammaproteobacteria bacterium]|nr:MAG: hypothetical protein BMS9Abin33_1154 [Gammaproteobacteria bacterium]
MPEPEDSQDDFNPKHRIVGAIIIVSLIVVFVPAILDKKELSDNKYRKLSDSSSSTKVVVTSVDALQRKATGKTGDAAGARSVTKDSRLTSPTNPLPVAKKEQARTSTSQTDKTEKPETDTRPGGTTTAKKGWIVQVGVYAKIDNAHSLRDRLTKQGYSIYLEEVRARQGKLSRVRVGPFKNEAEAKRVQASIYKEEAIKGVVIKLP